MLGSLANLCEELRGHLAEIGDHALFEQFVLFGGAHLLELCCGPHLPGHDAQRIEWCDPAEGSGSADRELVGSSRG